MRPKASSAGGASREDTPAAHRQVGGLPAVLSLLLRVLAFPHPPLRPAQEPRHRRVRSPAAEVRPPQSLGRADAPRDRRDGRTGSPVWRSPGRASPSPRRARAGGRCPRVSVEPASAPRTRRWRSVLTIDRATARVRILPLLIGNVVIDFDAGRSAVRSRHRSLRNQRRRRGRIRGCSAHRPGPLQALLEEFRSGRRRWLAR